MGEMPPPSPGKYRGSVVRQLSLQNQTPVQSPGPQRGLKKQVSEDYGRVLDAVEVTGQGWAGGSERSEPVLRIGSGDSKIGKVTGTRPKPVKVAWTDRKMELESPKDVEVVAKKCQGQPRPMSTKAQRLRNPLLGNKDTLVYTRLQLAERLRNAWSEREKIKPNLNIFLAHTSDATEPSSDRTLGNIAPETASTLSDSAAPLDKKRKSTQLRAFSQTICQPDETTPYEVKFPNEDTSHESNVPDKTSESTGRYLQELNKIEIRVSKAQPEAEGSENRNPEGLQSTDGDAPLSVKRSRNKVERESNGDENAENKAKAETAQDRRANFRRSSVLHKTITESFSSRSPQEEEKEKVPEESEEVKNPLKPSLKKPPLVRAFSAPSHNEIFSDSKSTALQKKVKIVPPRKLQPTVSFDIPDDPAAVRERIKSAPTRRKLKTAAARRKSKDKDSSDEEKEPKESASKKSTKRGQARKGGDIVTMVSLVSPAVSDTEDSVINLPLESWRGDEKEDQAPRAEDADQQPKEDPSFVLQKFVSLRKTAKSVSFQPHPVLSRSYSASFPSRRAPAGTPVIIPTPVVSNPALTPAQILERDKRPSVMSSAGTDGRGIKRRLLRSSTELSKKDESFDENSKSDSDSSHSEPPDHLNKNQGNEAEEKLNGEPDFKSPKEKECWNLYQKMVEKGVAVSFDTVLRGMLTPTEYRLRKNSLLSTC